jgi:hypothetical protein
MLHVVLDLFSYQDTQYPSLTSVRKIRLTACNAKCRFLKLTCKGTLRQVSYLSEASCPPPPLIRIHTGMGGGGGANQREG